jgi:DNA-binding NarL/FixJ family response regulator
MTPALRVLVADDQPILRAAVRAALEADGIEVCAEAGDATGAVEQAKACRPDLCLLDLHMPGNGLQAARRIAEELPDVPVVMFTVADDDASLFDAARFGVAGFLPKDMALDRLAAALHGVMRGEAAFPRATVTRLLEQLHDRGRTVRRSVPGRPRVTLTSREAEIVDLLRTRKTTATIARELFVSPATVRSHVASVLRKFGVRDRDALVALLHERGETSTPDYASGHGVAAAS